MKLYLFVLLSITSHLLSAQNWSVLGNTYSFSSSSSNANPSIDINALGNVYVIGDYEFPSFSERSGRVTVFKYNGSSFLPYGNELFGNGNLDRFGLSVSIDASGDVIAIGDLGDVNELGSVSIYDIVDNEWVLRGNPIIGNLNDGTGESCSLSADGNQIVIGQPLSDENDSNSGSMKVYQWINGSWQQKGNTLFGEGENSLFGNSVFSSDGTAIVTFNGFLSSANNKYIAVYTWNGLQWVPKGNFIDSSNDEDGIGRALSIDGDGSRIVVGFPGSSSSGLDNGAVRVYEFQNEGWIQIGETLVGDNESAMGSSVDISDNGNTIAIGIPYVFSFNNDFEGSAEVYSLSSSSWILQGDPITIPPLSTNSTFGSVLAMNENGSVVLVGTDYNSTASFVPFINDAVSSTNNTDNSQIYDLDIYPNPTFTNNIVLDYSLLPLSGKPYNYQIYTGTGSLVLEGKVNQIGMSKLINLSNISSGSYKLILIDRAKIMARTTFIKY